MGHFFIRRPIFAISMAIAITVMGLIAISHLSIEQYPNITPPIVEVSAVYTGADAQSVNNSVATPIAESVMGVSDMLYMQSTSANDGTMTLQVLFDIGTDADIDEILTQNRVSSALALLPESVTQQGVTTQKTMTSFLMVYTLHSSKEAYNDIFLTNYTQINMQDELLKIDGVGKVQIMGAGDYAMRVWIDPQRLSYYNISTDDIAEAIETQAEIYPAGKFGAEPAPSSTTYNYTITLPAQINSAEEFSQIILRATPQGEVVRLGDVAQTELGSQDYSVESRFNDDAAAMIIIYQQSGSNAVEVGAKVRKAMNRLTERLPEGIENDVVVDSTQSIKAGMRDIIKTLLIALLLVIIIIYIFLQDFRATLIPVITIPVSLIGAFILFPIFGFSINIVSLLGLVLAIGLVVDDAIVVVEAVQLNISKGLSPRDAAIAAMKSVTSPIIATTVVLLAVFIPVSLIASVSGLLFMQFAAIISLSVIISAICALTLSPALCSMLLRPAKPNKHTHFAAFNRAFERFMSRYTASATNWAKHIGRTAIFTLVIVILTALLWRSLPSGFLPTEDEGYLMVMVETPDNTTTSATAEAMAQINDVILSLKEVESTSYAAGFNMLAGISASNNGIFFVKLVDYDKRSLSAQQIARQLSGELYVEVPQAMAYAFIPPSIPGLGLTSGVSVEVQDLEGRGEEYLYEQTMILMDSLRNNPLVESVTTQYSYGVPQREIIVDTERAIALGVDPATLYSEIGTLLGGSYINNFNRFGRLYQTYIEAAPEFRQDEHDLENYYIASASEEQIPLNSLITIERTNGVEYISQFNLYSSISLTVNPAKRATSSEVMAKIKDIASSSLPEDIGIAWSGVSYQESVSSSNSGWIYLLIVIFVFLTLAALYNSWSLPLSVLLSVPIALLGALGLTTIAHLISSTYVNDIYMQISMIMLIGLAAKSAILVVEYANRSFFDEGKGLLESAITAAKTRVRPIIMTALAFILGVTPLIFASGVYSTARTIMGVALVGGLSVATIFGILLYPSLYYAVAKLSGLERKRIENNKDQKI